MTMKPSKPNKSLILNALFVLGGKHQPHEIKKWLDNNAKQPMDPDRNPVLSLNYYETRNGDDLGYEVLGSKPSNIIQEGNDASLGIKHVKTMDWRTVMRNLKILVEQDRVVKHDPKTGTYWLSADIRNEIRYFGVWFGEVAVSRLFLESKKDMTEFINRIGVYMVYIFIEAMAPFSNKKMKASDKDMLAIDWIESAIPIKTIFWRFVERFKGLEVVRGGKIAASKPAYEMEDTSKLESAVKRLNPEIYRILEDTKQYMGIDRNKRSVTRKRPSRV
jgi:hypothetical protein